MNCRPAILVMLAFLLSPPPLLAQTSAAGDRSYCDALMTQYDRFTPKIEGIRPGGKIEREVGEERCRRGQIAEGEKILMEAVRYLGYEPVPRPAR